MNAELQDRCDLLIVGAGPAGIAAALAAAPSGMAITLVDDNPAPGGQIWRDGPGATLPPTAHQRREALARHPNVRLLCATRVVAVLAPKLLLLEDPQQGRRLRYDKLILCTGARELLLPFPGWTLPGVTGAGGLQALIKGGLPVRGERLVVAGSGPLLLAVAATAAAAGAQVLRVAEQASGAALTAFAASLWRWPSKALQAATLLRPNFRSASHVMAACGQGRLESVQLQQGGQRHELACDRLACGFGLIPNTQLGQALGCALTAQQAIAVDAWQATEVDDHFAAGECTGFGGSERAWVQGTIAGLAASEQRDAAHRHWPQRQRWDRFAAALDQGFALNPALKSLAAPDTLVCRCEDVPYAALSGFDNWTEAKLHTRCGMGACQGRVCAGATAHLFGWNGPAPRTPLSPVRIGTLAACGQDSD